MIIYKYKHLKSFLLAIILLFLVGLTIFLKKTDSHIFLPKYNPVAPKALTLPGDD
jgi:hypothetical protein